MAIMVGKYSEKYKELQKKIIMTSCRIEKVSEDEAQRKYLNLTRGYHYRVVAGKDDVNPEPFFDTDDLFYIEDDEIVDLMERISALTAHVRDNPTEFDREETIDFIAAMSKALYTLHTLSAGEETIG